MSSTWKILTAALAVGALAAGGAAAAGHGRDDYGRTQRGGQATQVYTLAAPEHGNPEGVAFDERSGTYFVSSVVDGTIYRGQLNDTATPVPVFVPGGTGQAATGMKVSRGRLYVAGASTGTIKIYDVATGALLATFDTKGASDAPTFVNDLVVTQRGDVFATDSFRPVVYHLSAAEIAAGRPAATPINPADVISTSPEIPFDTTPGAVNLNGIVAFGNNEVVVGDSHSGRLFRIEAPRRQAAQREIRELNVAGGPFPANDGLPLDRGALLVAQNSDTGFPNGVLDVVALRHGGRDGVVVQRRADPTFRTPSTIARTQDRYLVVNADFATNTKPFTVSGLAR